MNQQAATTQKPQVLLSCYHHRSREGEQFTADHVFSYQVSGILRVNDGTGPQACREGDLRFVRRNSLIKYEKEPPPGGQFKSLSIILDQETLRALSLEWGIAQAAAPLSPAISLLPPDPLYLSFMQSLLAYVEKAGPGMETLLGLKVREAVMLLLKINPALRNVLFDFAEPGKIDLEAFMNQHFHFNVALHRFAYLTGRSLATFKRDFSKIFHVSPSRWLLQRRLHEAHFLLREKGRSASDIYLDLGFENLSHFSFAFKKAYGVAPSKV